MRNQLSENAANTRTLILSLVVALAVMVPLRFYQAGVDLADSEMEYDTMAKVSEYKALRLANLNRQSNTVAQAKLAQEQQRAVLGVSDEVSGPNCISSQNAQDLINSLFETAGSTNEDLKVLDAQSKEILNRVCQ